MKEVAVGVDIGGTNTAIGFVDCSGEIVALTNIETPTEGSFSSYIEQIAQCIVQSTPADVEVVGIGIGAPNACYHTGVIKSAANLCWQGELPLVKLLKGYFPGIPIKVTNDANAATIGEMVYGDAKGMRDFVMITLGSGVGSGFVANGELIYGHDGFAGEVGHIIVEPNGRECGCGRRGCLETYTSARGIVRTAHEILAQSTEPSSLRGREITSFDLFQAAQAGDAIALELFERCGTTLGQALANIVTVTAPEKVFIFGGLANAGELIFNPIRRAFRETAIFLWCDTIEIVPSGLQGKNIAILGAASLVHAK